MRALFTSLLQVGPGDAGPALIALGLGIGVVVMAMRARRRRRVRELLFRDAPVGVGTSAAAPQATESRGDVRALEDWLSSAGYEGPSVRFQFVLWCVAAALLGGFTALLVDSSGVSERASAWLEEIPGGVAEILVPVMNAATWLIALLIAMVPIVWVRRERRRRANEVERDLPTVLSLLATLVESGLGFDASAQRVERSLGDGRVLSSELSRVRAATLAGVPRATAIRSMAERLDVPSLTTFSSALVHAENQGASIGDTLRRQATDLWSRRREEAIQKAQTLPTKLAFPLVICFLPGVFVWTFGPAVAEFVDLASSVLADRH